ncbi:MAG TPA: hypothetical protein VF506_09875 [Streptosporangiaceae bacterium]
MTAAFERNQPGIRDRFCHGSPARSSDDRVLRSLDDQGRAANLRSEPKDCVPVVGPLRVHAAQDRIRVGLHRPPDSVLGLLGGVRLGERLREEELGESGPVTKKVLAIPFRPAFGCLGLFVERVGALLGGRVVG